MPTESSKESESPSSSVSRGCAPGVNTTLFIGLLELVLSAPELELLELEVEEEDELELEEEEEEDDEDVDVEVELEVELELVFPPLKSMSASHPLFPERAMSTKVSAKTIDPPFLARPASPVDCFRSFFSICCLM